MQEQGWNGKLPNGATKWRLRIGLALALTLLVAACSHPKDPFPRPKGWPRIDLPAHAYQKFENAVCPFTFEYPQIGTIEKQKSDSCWMDLYFKKF